MYQAFSKKGTLFKGGTLLIQGRHYLRKYSMYVEIQISDSRTYLQDSFYNFTNSIYHKLVSGFWINREQYWHQIYTYQYR